MDQFYVRLESLENLGTNRLPAIRDSLTAALAELDEGMRLIFNVFDTREFTRPDDPEAVGGIPSRYYLFWQPGRDSFIMMEFMRQIFRDNAENVDLAAQAIREITLRYRQVDGQA